MSAYKKLFIQYLTQTAIVPVVAMLIVTSFYSCVDTSSSRGGDTNVQKTPPLTGGGNGNNLSYTERYKNEKNNIITHLLELTHAEKCHDVVAAQTLYQNMQQTYTGNINNDLFRANTHEQDLHDLFDLIQYLQSSILPALSTIVSNNDCNVDCPSGNCSGESPVLEFPAISNLHLGQKNQKIQPSKLQGDDDSDFECNISSPIPDQVTINKQTCDITIAEVKTSHHQKSIKVIAQNSGGFQTEANVWLSVYGFTFNNISGKVGDSINESPSFINNIDRSTCNIFCTPVGILDQLGLSMDSQCRITGTPHTAGSVTCKSRGTTDQEESFTLPNDARFTIQINELPAPDLVYSNPYNISAQNSQSSSSFINHVIIPIVRNPNNTNSTNQNFTSCEHVSNSGSFININVNNQNCEVTLNDLYEHGEYNLKIKATNDNNISTDADLTIRIGCYTHQPCP